jgi:hypothetical protein
MSLPQSPIHESPGLRLQASSAPCWPKSGSLAGVKSATRAELSQQREVTRRSCWTAVCSWKPCPEPCSDSAILRST